MDDLISRQAVLDAFGLSEKTRKYGGDHSGYDTMMLYEIQDVIEDLPSAEPQGSMAKWIPVSERLPEEENKVLCCTVTKKGTKNLIIGWYDHGLKMWATGMNRNVIAWMPLPEPYKEETK